MSEDLHNSAPFRARTLLPEENFRNLFHIIIVGCVCTESYLALASREATGTEALEVADHIAARAAVATRILGTLVNVDLAALAFETIWASTLEGADRILK